MPVAMVPSRETGGARMESRGTVHIIGMFGFANDVRSEPAGVLCRLDIPDHQGDPAVDARKERNAVCAERIVG